MSSNFGPKYDLAKRIRQHEDAIRALSTRDILKNPAVFGDVVNALSVYNSVLSGSTRVVSVASTGQLGYVPSSRQFKQDVQTAELDPAVVLALRLVTFRYIAAVEEEGAGAVIEWGLIAEEVHELGLTWVVDYDDAGAPFGIKYDRLVLALLPYLGTVEKRQNDLEERLRILEERTPKTPRKATR